MVGLLLITHGALGDDLLRTAAHTLGQPLERAESVAVSDRDTPETLLVRARAALARLDDGSGVLLLTDMFGATPANVAAKLLANGRVEGLSGASLPMVVRALAHRHEALAAVVEKARSGASEGVVYMNTDRCCRA